MEQSDQTARDQYLTVSEVAAALRVSNMTVYRLVSSGELPAVKVGRCLRLPVEEVDRYLAGRLLTAR